MKTHPKVIYQGLPGSFSSQAARSLYGEQMIPLHASKFREIFISVNEGSADVGIVPIENALAGSVHENYDLLTEFPCSIIAETSVSVQLQLLGSSKCQGQEIKSITRVYSHYKALEQCTHFFEQHPTIERVTWPDTASAAKHVADLGEPQLAALASSEAAKIYSLTTIAANIQNDLKNSTRFIAIAKAPKLDPKSNKCSLIVWLAHKPGSLYKILGEISNFTLNITKLEARPIVGNPFSYSFHIDIECYEKEAKGTLEPLKALNDAIERISRHSERVKVLGSYRTNA